MHKFRLIQIFIVACMLFNLFGSETFSNQALASSPPQDNVPETPCYSLDVIFLVDKSSSMLENDPENLRKEAFDWVITWLGDNVLSQCRDGVHTIGVIGFAGDAWVELDFSSIAPTDRGQWTEVTRPDLQSKVTDQLGGGTQPLHAFDLARQLFDGASMHGNYPHKRLLVLMSDGEPCGVECTANYAGRYGEQLYDRVKEIFPFDPTLLQQEQCLDEARLDGEATAEEKYQCFKDFPVDSSDLPSSTYIWAVLLNQGRPYYSGFKEWLDQITEEHAGQTISLTRNTDVPARFLEIMTEMVGVKAEPLECGLFPMEPYLEQATLQFFKIDPSITVNITYERDNRTYNISQENVVNQSMPFATDGFTLLDYTQDATIERYVFYHPRGGQWKITASDCQGIQAYFESLELSSNLAQVLNREIPQMDLPPYYDVDNPIHIEFYLLDQVNQGGKVEEDPLYPVNIDLSITRPDGSVENIAVDYDADLMVFRNPEPLNVFQAGTYRFSIRATAPYADGDKQRSEGSRLLLDEGPISFEVATVEPFAHLMSTSQTTIPQVDIEPYYEEDYPVYIQYQLVDSLGRKHQAGINSNYPINIHITITKPDGSVEEADLIYDVEQDLFRTQNPLNVSQVGEYSVIANATIGHVINGQTTDTRTLFTDGANKFYVNAVTPFIFSILEPVDGERITLHSGIPTNLELNTAHLQVALTDRAGNPLDPNDVFLNAEVPLAATLEANGQVIPVNLVRDVENTGQYLGETTVVDFEGQQKFTISFQGGYDRENYRPDPPFAQSVQLLVQDTVFTSPATYRVLAILAVLAAIIAIVLVIINRKNPVRGTLHFELGTANIASFELGSGWNTTRIGRKALAVAEGLGLRSLKAHNSRNTPGAIEYQAIGLDGTRYGDELTNNAPRDFTGGISVRYESLAPDWTDENQNDFNIDQS